MINRDKTKMKFGYYPEELAETSSSLVVWQCDDCNEQRDYSYAYALKKYKKSLEQENNKELCQKCAHKHRKGKVEKSESVKHKAVKLPQEVDLSLTMERFGVNAEDLSPWSRQKVVLRCECGNISETKRCNLNSSKSIQETGHYKCVGCCTKERRSGITVSEITRKKMMKSQQKRRNKNKKPMVLRPAANGENFAVSKNNENNIIGFPKKK